jgi:PST family polysaccharide transporter
MSFSVNLVGFNILNYIVRNADNALIGRFLGASDLGFYSMAYRLMLWPLQNISAVIGRTLFPAFSGLQSDRQRLRESYTRATAAIAFVTAPLMCGFFVLREPFIAFVLGPDWALVADILTWLIPIGLLQSIGTGVGSLYMATGRTDVMFKWGLGAGIAFTTAFAVGLQWGVIGVAAAYALMSLLLFWPSLAIPYRLIGLKVSALLLRISPPIASACLMAVIVAAAASVLRVSSEDRPVLLMMCILLGMAAYAGLSLVLQREIVRDIRAVVFKRQL